MSMPDIKVTYNTSIGAFVKSHLRDYILLIALAAIMLFFQYTTDGTLFEPVNLTNIILQNSYIIVMALGMLLVIVAGHIDLSVGSVSGFVRAVAAVLMVEYKVHFVPAAIICLVLGAVIGAAQGYWVAFYKIPSFIVTLAGMLVFKGLALAVLGGSSVGPFPPEFQLLSTGFIPDPFAGETLRVTSLIAGVLMALVLLISKVRGRAERVKHGMDNEPYVFFLLKNMVFAVMIAAFSYMLSTYKGC